MHCDICGEGPTEGVTVFRVNPPGDDGVWRCRGCLSSTQLAAIDPITLDIADILEGDT